MTPHAADFAPITTQDELNDVVQEAVAAIRQQYADYDVLKATAEEAARSAEQARVEREQACEAARLSGAEAARTAMATRLMRSEAKALAVAAGFRNIDLAVSLLDLGSVHVDDEGQVDTAAIQSQLDALASAEPYLLDPTRRTT